MRARVRGHLYSVRFGRFFARMRFLPPAIAAMEVRGGARAASKIWCEGSGGVAKNQPGIRVAQSLESDARLVVHDITDIDS